MSVWTEIYARFDPEVTDVDVSWRVERPHGPFRSIKERLALQDDESKVLLTGTVGSGKSTELLRVAEARSADEFVVLLDLDRHFTNVVGDSAALRQVEAWEVCFLACVALVRAAREQLDCEVDEATLRDLADAWRKAAVASKTPDPGEVDVIGLGKSMFVTASEGIIVAGAALNPVAAGVGRVALAALRALSDATKWRLPMGRAQAPLVDQDESMRTLLAVANRIVGEVQLKARRVLLVLDGLDRITDIAHARRLFLDSGMLGSLLCSVVLCAPFAMRHAMDLARVRRFHCVTLVNEPVLDPHHPESPGAGVEVMREMYRRRVSDLGAAAALDGSMLDRVAYYSGGRARDFVRLIRNVAAKVRVRGGDAPSAALVDEVLDEMRRLYEIGLNKGHVQLLEDIAADPQHDLPSDESAWELLQQDRLLPYSNGSEWFFPHPLLTLNKVTRWKTP